MSAAENTKRNGRPHKQRRLPKKLQGLPPQHFGVLYLDINPGATSTSSQSPDDSSDNEATPSPGGENPGPAPETPSAAGMPGKAAPTVLQFQINESPNGQFPSPGTYYSGPPADIPLSAYPTPQSFNVPNDHHGVPIAPTPSRVSQEGREGDREQEGLQEWIHTSVQRTDQLSAESRYLAQQAIPSETQLGTYNWFPNVARYEGGSIYGDMIYGQPPQANPQVGGSDGTVGLWGMK